MQKSENFMFRVITSNLISKILNLSDEALFLSTWTKINAGFLLTFPHSSIPIGMSVWISSPWAQ
jgi:hypothetical protein